AAAAVRERLSQEHWNVIVHAEQEFFRRCAEQAGEGDYSSLEAVRVLEAASGHMATITGAQTDRMTRDDGWRLLSIGRNLERLGFLASALAEGFESGSVHSAGGFEALLSLFDSTITFHSQYQQSRDVAALLDLLVLDRDNPRSLGWVAQTIRGRLDKLSSRAGGITRQAITIPDPANWELTAICTQDDEGHYALLQGLLAECTNSAYQVSDAVSAHYFTHSGDSKLSLGA
ncbi:MAG TPA: alpha-E domain-containing protein, partial [Burkholderiaceae bacterium]